jgi:hypothetical protein
MIRDGDLLQAILHADTPARQRNAIRRALAVHAMRNRCGMIDWCRVVAGYMRASRRLHGACYRVPLPILRRAYAHAEAVLGRG